MDDYTKLPKSEDLYMADWIGYKWLEEEYGVEAVQPFAVSSCIGKARTSKMSDGFAVETYPENFRPVASFSAHLTFALRREGVHLEFLARLFERVPTAVMSEWVKREPSGQYARRAGFFYEWLTDKHIDFDGVTVGNYVEALPKEEYLVRSQPVNVARWRVRDNLPGTKFYCPLVRRTEEVRAAEGYDTKARLHALENEFGADILQRSAVWLTIKESRASFEIEHEANQLDRIELFAVAMEKWCGNSDNPLDVEFLGQLQAEILGKRALRLGVRKSPVFVGEMRHREPVVHYVAPHFEQIGPLLEGLQAFAELTVGGASVVRAAVLAFGFVYIHPMADGNGRISRFLVNDTLRRDGASPAPYIVPVSSTITSSVANRAAYDGALERYSRPLLARYRNACTFGAVRVCEDGVRTDFQFSAYDEAQLTWAFPDLTAQAEYLGEVVRETIEVEMRGEADFLQEHSRLRERVKEVMEAPDVEIDRLIRSIQQNGGVISGKLAGEFPPLEDEEVARAIVAAVLG